MQQRVSERQMEIKRLRFDVVAAALTALEVGVLKAADPKINKPPEAGAGASAPNGVARAGAGAGARKWKPEAGGGVAVVAGAGTGGRLACTVCGPGRG